MIITSHHNDVDHRRLPAFFGRQGAMQLLRIPPYKIDVEFLIVAHPLLFQGEEDRVAEFILFQFRLHAFFQAVVIPFVAEGVLDLDDLAVGATHQALDQQFSARGIALVPEIGPVGFAFPSAQGDGVSGFAEVAGDFQFDVLGDVDAFTAHLDVLFVFGSELKDVVLAQLR